MIKKTVAFRAFVATDNPNPFLCFWPKYNVVLDLTEFKDVHSHGSSAITSALKRNRDISGMFGTHTQHWKLSVEKLIQILNPYVREGEFPKSIGCRIS